MKLAVRLFAAALVSWSGVALADQPVLIASYTPEQRAAIEYYRRNYPAYYVKYYAPVLDGREAPPPPKPPDEGADEVEEEGDTGLAVAGLVSGETEMNGARTLDGHTFQYPRLIDSPFTATNFHVGSSVEVYHQGDVKTSVSRMDGSSEELTYDRDLVFLRMAYGIAFAPHEAVTLGLDADYLIEVGADQQAIILYGGQTGYDFRPAAKLRVFRSDAAGVQLAIKGFGTFSGGIRAVPTGLLTHLGSTGEDEESCLAAADVGCAVADEGVSSAVAITRERRGGGGSFNLAKSMGRFLGTQLSVGLEGARAAVTSPDSGPVTATGLVFTAGASPSLNFYPGWPVALTLEYRFEWHRNAYDANPKAGVPDGFVLTAMGHRFGAGIYYSGRRDLLLGWSAGASLLEDADRGPDEIGTEQPDAMLFAAQFDMRYFF